VTATSRPEPRAPREERVVLVDADDVPVGVQEKLRAHEDGSLHRAVSVFLFDPSGALLLQRRALAKYHSGGLWSNAACGHPRPDESTLGAARRRLREEMGLDCALRPAFRFTYRAELGGGLSEHEVDHVFVGRCDAEPEPDPAEVEAWKWMTIEDVRADLQRRPERYTAWFGLVLDEILRHRAHEVL
jgi:isopentenyl-diphosphate Delta-isomerase